MLTALAGTPDTGQSPAWSPAPWMWWMLAVIAAYGCAGYLVAQYWSRREPSGECAPLPTPPPWSLSARVLHARAVAAAEKDVLREQDSWRHRRDASQAVLAVVATLIVVALVLSMIVSFFGSIGSAPAPSPTYTTPPGNQKLMPPADGLRVRR